MNSTSIQGSSSSGQIYKHDVYLSFRGTDARNFVGHLYAHFQRKGIFAFMDDMKLRRWENISSQLRQAIEHSRVSIVVFSKDYANSSWCLEEMATIDECKEKLGQIVLPVFYDVDPSDVRRQRGEYRVAFAEHTKRFEESPDKVGRWRRVMTNMANLVGWDVRRMLEFQVIENIVLEVVQLLGLHTKFSWWADKLVGIQSRVEVLGELLKLGSNNDDFRVLGIWGMGGIGKTTYTKVLYDRISYQFEASCFIDDVSKTFMHGGAVDIQKQIVRQTLDKESSKWYNHSQIGDFARNRLSCLKVLIVLDNVDSLWQLHELDIGPKLFHQGSRIIITTRDESILKAYRVDEIYRVPLLTNDEAHELFCKNAFKSNDDPSSSHEELIPKVLEYADGLPLAIKVLGSSLHGRDAAYWTNLLDRLQYYLIDKIVAVLKTSFDTLTMEEQNIFLHIACFFKGKDEDYVKRILDCCGLHPTIGIQVLMEKSLVTIVNKKIQMHRMFQELGKRIVWQESPRHPEFLSRLWLYKDFHYMMTADKERIEAKAIVLDQEEDVNKWGPLKGEAFSKMGGLELLILNHGHFSGSLNFLSHNLCFLLWHSYPFTSLPLNFEPSRLVELNMPGSCLIRLWEGLKHLPELRRMDLSGSKDLEMTPDFESMPNLEWLDLAGCTKLSQVHPSIGSLQKLAFLSLRNCTNLISLLHGDSKSNLSSLQVLDLAGCRELTRTPDFTRLPNLESLNLEQCTSLRVIDESIGVLIKLKSLSLRYCINLVIIPDSINNIIDSLETLDLHDCPKLKSPPLMQRTKGAVDPLEQEEAGRNSPNCYMQSSPSCPRICRYDVFLSFRGIDVRKSFISHLYSHLIRKGIFTFKDDEKTEKGELISPQLEQAIKDSRVSIVVFSKNYASSKWCLEEMATIVECRQNLRQTVFPIFYDVAPSEVRDQKGDYEEAFAQHAANFPGKVDRWKRAMESLANSVGWDVQNQPEFEQIERIVENVIRSLDHKFSMSADDLVGIQPHIEVLENLLRLSSEDGGFQVLGIWGMAGIGKTTHAKVLYDRIFYQFHACCFIENISTTYKNGGASAIHKQILHQTFKENNLESKDPLQIAGMVKDRLPRRKVLIVLDNVDNLEQLKNLAMNPKLLHPGSRIIITTRNENILKVYRAQVYKVPQLTNAEARELFIKKAFQSVDPSSDYEELISEVLEYADHLPLAITELGSLLHSRDATHWREILNGLREYPEDKIMKELKMSFEELQTQERDIFMYIANFVGKKEDFIQEFLAGLGLPPSSGIRIMAEKSLITIENNTIQMHKLLQELGKKILRSRIKSQDHRVGY